MKIYCDSRDAWLEERKQSIGGSDIACVMGHGYKTALQLWQEKTGQKESPDLSDNERIQKGVTCEPILRELYEATHKGMEVDYEHDVLYRSDDSEFYFAHYSPDGELVERNSDRLGILEIKTATCLSKADWGKWMNRIPDNYFDQILWGMFVMDREFADVFALLENIEGDYELRTYHFEKAASLDYLNEMKQKAKEFWRAVERKSVPSVKLSL